MNEDLFYNWVRSKKNERIFITADCMSDYLEYVQKERLNPLTVFYCEPTGGEAMRDLHDNLANGFSDYALLFLDIRR